ncbi:MAG: response regulator transcription factor [Gammaproteobacteria bacterium]|nr:response regulator transcription factor [Gammaproteobacteria bacterium]MCP5138489.1 response regulator transcription factor [Chromatiales bacterium]
MSSMKRRVLIIEDEQDLALLIKRHLEGSGFEVQTVSRGDDGLRAAETAAFDLILLDLMLPGMDGIEVCRRLRDQKIATPIMMVTARTTEVDKVLGLDMGADDYIAKPFGIAELTARVKAILRRIEGMETAHATGTGSIQIGDAVCINPSSRQVMVRGKAVSLTPKEFDLMVHFARNPGRVYTRSQLLDTVWGYRHDGYEHAVNCHINRLREKIERDQTRPELLLTVWGVGYKLAESLPPES